MKEEEVHIPPTYMPHDDLQILLERYYSYGRDWPTRWAHRLRINCINRLIDSYTKDLYSNRTHSLKALDLGCGKGAYAYLLAQRGFYTLGIDISREEIKDAAEWTSANLFIGDAERLPFRDSSFDLVICSEVIEHLNSPSRGMGELCRVLRFGGIAIISMPNLFSYFWLRGLAYQLARQFVSGKFRTSDIDAHMKFPFWRISLTAKQAGLKTLAGASVFFSFPLMNPFISHFLNSPTSHFPSTIRAFHGVWERMLRKTPLLRNFGAFYILVCAKT